jgi:hypothetical protein
MNSRNAMGSHVAAGRHRRCPVCAALTDLDHTEALLEEARRSQERINAVLRELAAEPVPPLAPLAPGVH